MAKKVNKHNSNDLATFMQKIKALIQTFKSSKNKSIRLLIKQKKELKRMNTHTQSIMYTLSNGFNQINKSKDSKAKIIILAIFILLTPIHTFSNNKENTLHTQQQNSFKVAGIVTDISGESIIGATIVEKGPESSNVSRTITNINGQYEISLSNENATLVISYIGYETQEIKVQGRSNINIRLYENTEALDEVVVIGYGQQKKNSLVSSINSISDTELKFPNRSLANNLSGQIAGLIAVQRSGEPGYDNAEFWIRGVSSFKGGTNPLILVDGVPRNMNDVEPDEIESFSLLKDAAATAVYGAEGANGVILITTKRGVVAPARISVRAETSVLQPTRLPRYADSYEYLSSYNEAMNNMGSPSPYSDETLQNYKNGTDPDLYPNSNWYDLLKKHTTNSRVTINARGGSEKAKYFVSGSFFTESGLFKSNPKEDYDANIGLKRFNLRSNIDLDLTKSTIVSIDISGQYINTNYPGVGTQELFTRMSVIPSHLFPMIYSDGTIAGHPNPSSIKINPYNQLNNSGYAKEWRSSIQSKVTLNQKLDFITKGLSFRGSVAFDANMLYSMSRSKTVTQYNATARDAEGNLIFNEVVSGSNTLGGASSGSSGNKNIYIEGSLNYAKLFNEKHNFSAMLLYMQKEYQPHNQPLAFKKQGVIGRTSYAYDERYSIEANFGYTGSETFAKGHRFGFFPAVGAAWYISNERFYSDNIANVINKLKVRASYGRTGNDDTGGSRFLYRETMNTGGPGYNVGFTDSGGNGGVGNSIIQGQFYAPSIGWEIETKQNYGLEIGMFQNRIDIQVDYFFNKRSNILLQRQTVGQVPGFQVMPWQNYGVVNNRGFDASIVLNHNIGKVKLAARGNFTFARNKIIEYDEIPQKYSWMDVTNTRIGDRSIYICDGFYSNDDFIITGEGLEREYTLKEGVVKSGLAGDIKPGDLKYRDLNGDGTIDSFDAKRGIVNPENPEIVYGFGLSAEWNNFTISAFFQGAGNTETILGSGSNNEALWPFLRGVNESRMRKEFLNHWSDSDPYNFNVTYPRLRPESHTHNNVASTFWVRNGAFIRFKNLEISYKLPLNKRFGIQNSRLYLQGNNLAVWDNLKMWDPELGNRNSGSGYPLARTFTLGLDITF